MSIETLPLVLLSGEGCKLEAYHATNDPQPLFTWAQKTTHPPPQLAWNDTLTRKIMASNIWPSFLRKHTILGTFIIGVVIM